MYDWLSCSQNRTVPPLLLEGHIKNGSIIKVPGFLSQGTKIDRFQALHGDNQYWALPVHAVSSWHWLWQERAIRVTAFELTRKNHMLSEWQSILNRVIESHAKWVTKYT